MLNGVECLFLDKDNRRGIKQRHLLKQCRNKKTTRVKVGERL